MNKPYAAVILPTLNRAETLPIALASVRNQTIFNIDILLVLDGATAQCRKIANAAAKDDPRVRVLDLPKAPGAGLANVAVAIRETNAPRIFYIDDDDIWTPHHIASLGPYLDHADVVDCPTVSLGFMGDLHLAPMTTGNDRMRSLLANWKYKRVFDVHIAHRREVCASDISWSSGEHADTRPIWAFLGTLARNNDINWVSTPTPTSLSVHGVCRRDIDTLERTVELADWAIKTSIEDVWQKSVRSADCCNHAATLLVADPPEEENSDAAFINYFSIHGYDVGQLKESVYKQLRDLYSLACGEMIAVDRAAVIVDWVTRPVIWCQNFREGYALIRRACSSEETVEVLRAIATSPVDNPAGCWGALAVALSNTGDQEQALSAIEMACRLGPDPNGVLAAFKQELM